LSVQKSNKDILEARKHEVNEMTTAQATTPKAHSTKKITEATKLDARSCAHQSES
jgi:hypothetical protein